MAYMNGKKVESIELMGIVNIDQTYSPDSENPQSGKAVAYAIAEALKTNKNVCITGEGHPISSVPFDNAELGMLYMDTITGDLWKCTYKDDDEVMWGQETSHPDLEYNPDSYAPQSGKAVAKAISTRVALEEVTGDNLVNPETAVVGAIQSNGTIATNGAWGGYITSEYIELEQDTDYAFTIHNIMADGSIQQLGTTYHKLALLFDENKNVLADSYKSVSSPNDVLTFNSLSAKYVRVSSRSLGVLQLKKGTTNTPFVPYTLNKQMNEPIGDVPYKQTQKSNVLYGKKWAVLGDSFTNGSNSSLLTDGKYKGYNKVYPYIIGGRNDMKVVRFFDGGRTLAYPENAGAFTNSVTCPTSDYYYQNIPEDVDYITIYLGINDEGHFRSSSSYGEDATGLITLGTIDDVGTATYYGAWNEILSWLIVNRPFAHIGIIVTNGLSNSEYDGVHGNDWRMAQINIAKKYGIPYIDLNGDERTPAMCCSVNPDISNIVKDAITQKQAVSYPSNKHPNDETHEYESYFIENFLRSL